MAGASGAAYMAAAGAALFAAGTALLFISETVRVLAVVLLLARIRLPARAERVQASRVRDEIREGWHWVWAQPAVRTLAITTFTFNITFGAPFRRNGGPAASNRQRVTYTRICSYFPPTVRCGINIPQT